MTLNIPQEISWDCSEGTRNATFYEFKEVSRYTKRGEEKFVRLVFQLDELSTEDSIVLVGRNFVPSLKKGSDLRLFLDTWLGDDFVDQHKQGGKFDLEALNGRRGEIVVKHFENQGYAVPFVHLQAAYPLGTLRKQESYMNEREGI